MYPGEHQGQHLQPGKGRDCPDLFCSGAASPQVMGVVWGATYKIDTKLLETVHGSATKMVKGLEVK